MRAQKQKDFIYVYYIKNNVYTIIPIAVGSSWMWPINENVQRLLLACLTNIPIALTTNTCHPEVNDYIRNIHWSNVYSS